MPHALRPGPSFTPFTTTYITVHFDSTTEAKDPASAVRKFKHQYTARVGTQIQVGVTHDRPAPIQRRRRGLQPFCKYAMGQLLTGAEALRQIHRAQGAHPHTNYCAEHWASADVRQLFTVQWRDGPANERIRIVDVVPDAGLPSPPRRVPPAIDTLSRVLDAPLVIRSWNVASLLAGDGVAIPAAARRRRKVDLTSLCDWRVEHI